MSWTGRFTVHKLFYDVLEGEGILPFHHLREYCCTSWINYSTVLPLIRGPSEITTLGFIPRHPLSTTLVKQDLKAFRDLAGPLPASVRVLKVAGYGFHPDSAYHDFFFPSLLALPRIEVLHMGLTGIEAVLPDNVLQHVLSLDTLEDIRTSNPSDDLLRCLKRMRGTGPTFRLRRYVTLASNLDVCLEILRRIAVSCLQSIDIQSISPLSASDVENFFRTVESRCSPSVLREITLDEDCDSLTDPVTATPGTSMATMNTLRPLFPFSHLEQLHVDNTALVFPFVSDDVEIFRESWPKMRSMKLVGRQLEIHGTG